MNEQDPVVLITGANRGVGLALVKVFAAQGWRVLATARDPARAGDLAELVAGNPKISIEALDVTEVESIAALAARHAGQPIDLLFNNAAVLGDADDEGNQKQKLGGLDQALFTEVMKINAFGPLKLAEALTENIVASTQKKIITLTSGLGSLTMMESMSLFYFYQMSKAALNMGLRALRHDLRPRGVTVGILAPGLVKTQLLAASGYTGEALSPDDSAAGLYKLATTMTIEDAGLPINVDGQVFPW